VTPNLEPRAAPGRKRFDAPAWYKHLVRQKLAMLAALATGVVLLGAAILLAYARSLTP
jgi:hypothetical protein